MQTEQEICLPNIGDFDQVDVVEIHVSEGDTINTDDPILSLESEKATMDIPAPSAGTVKKLLINIGDKIAEGAPLLLLEVSEETDTESNSESVEQTTEKETATDTSTESLATEPPATEPVVTSIEESAHSQAEPSSPPAQIVPQTSDGSLPHASPSVRRFARELGVDLNLVTPSGPKNRILKDDVKRYTKGALQSQQSGAGVANALSTSISPAKLPDFEKFGPIERMDLTKINQLSAENLYQNWINIPHVTLQEEADITELEAFRNEHKAQAKQQGFNLTITSFVIKAVANTLRTLPRFRSSLDWANKQLIVKDYCHIGVAVDTPNGLYVPVIKDADQKSLFQIAEELQELAEKAKAKKLTPTDMQGAVFTISSLGSIGCTGFTPIINAPEVAILGISRSDLKPGIVDGQVQSRLMLPMSLSIDHRVIDGGDGARFCSHLRTLLSDIRTQLL